MPREQVECHGIDPDELRPVIDAVNRGDVAEGARLTTPEIGDKLTCAGTPEEIVERLQEAVVPSGINHVMFGLTDPYLVEKWSGHRIQNVPDLQGHFRLIHDRIMPVFA